MRAIVLLSGGIDSTVSLAIALDKGRDCSTLSFDYGQRHIIELESAKKITSFYSVPHKIITIDRLAFGKSSLVGSEEVPKNRSCNEISHGQLPNTYVPARNTLFLSYALSFAEIYHAEEIYFGPNAMDAHSYPDCSGAFVQAFQEVANVATRQGALGHPPKIIAPLIEMDKTAIIRKGKELKAPLEMTMSCYDPTVTGNPCGQCDACIIRRMAFASVT